MGRRAPQAWPHALVLNHGLEPLLFEYAIMNAFDAAFRAERPGEAEYGAFYGKYIRLVPPGDVVHFLDRQRETTAAFLRTVSPEEALTRHPPYTWSLHQVLGHLIDSERIFGTRALCIARGEKQALPGFDENAYVQEAAFDRRPWMSLVEEFDHLRRGHVLMFEAMDAIAWNRVGVANQLDVSVRASAFILAGHVEHHLAILHKRLGR